MSTVITTPERLDNGQFAPRHWTPVESSNLAALAFIPVGTLAGVTFGRMYVTFTSGDVYRYDCVPEVEFDTIIASESPGGALHDRIKVFDYAYEQVVAAP
jgi:hypothetical protein